MLCKKCREVIEVGEACRAEQSNAHHVFYHLGCYAEVKRERQAVPLDEQVKLWKGE